MLGKQASKAVFQRAKGQSLNKCMCINIMAHFLSPKNDKVQKKNVQGAEYYTSGELQGELPRIGTGRRVAGTYRKIRQSGLNQGQRGT